MLSLYEGKLNGYDCATNKGVPFLSRGVYNRVKGLHFWAEPLCEKIPLNFAKVIFSDNNLFRMKYSSPEKHGVPELNYKV